MGGSANPPQKKQRHSYAVATQGSEAHVLFAKKQGETWSPEAGEKLKEVLGMSSIS